MTKATGYYPHSGIMADSPPVNAKGEALAKLEVYGIDQLCADILDGVTHHQIADNLGVSVGSLLAWRERDAERSARAKEARVMRAEMWDELAIKEIRAATDKISLGQAKEIAHHYRWRARVTNPAQYGDKVVQEHTGRIKLEDTRAPIEALIAPATPRETT